MANLGMVWPSTAIHVCMAMYCIYACIYVCLHMYGYVCMAMYVWICMYVCSNVYVHVCVNACIIKQRCLEWAIQCEKDRKRSFSLANF